MPNRLSSYRQSACTRARRMLAVPLAAAACGLAATASAAPVNITYLKDAQAASTAPFGSATPNIFFSTPPAGLNQTSFTQASETVTARESQIAGSATASTTYEANIAPGTLKALSNSTTTGTFGGSAGTGLRTSADQVLGIRDTLQVGGGTPGGTVNVNFSLMLDSLLSSIGVPTSNTALCGYGSVSLWADVGTSRVAALTRNLCTGTDSMTSTGSFLATVGQDFDLSLGMEILSQSAIGAGNVFGSSVSVDASHTGLIYLVAPTGYTLTSTSGHSYLESNGGGNNGGGSVPLPGTLALAALGLAALPRRRRGR